MSWANWIIEKLSNNEEVICYPKGNSMTPYAHSGEKCLLRPIKHLNKVKPWDIVLCEVGEKQYLHFVIKVNKSQGCLISNAHGKVNGWTKKVYGLLIK